VSNVLPFTHDVAQARIEQARQGANPDWLDFAEQCVRFVAQFGPEEFSVDDVHAEMDVRRRLVEAAGSTLPTTPKGQALGAVMLKLSRAGVIEFTGTWRASTRKHSQRQPVRVWRRAA
jgi:hypothetical protein